MIFRILHFYRLLHLGCPEFVCTTGFGCNTPPCFSVMLATGWEFAGRDGGLAELWNT